MSHRIERMELVRIVIPRMNEKCSAHVRKWRPAVWSVSTEEGLLAVRLRETGTDRYAILHRNTKAAYRGRYAWQLTRFDSEGPTGDTPRATAAEALTDGLDGVWTVETVACRAVR